MYLDGWIQNNTGLWYVHHLACSFYTSQPLLTEFNRDSSPQWWSLVKHCEQWPLSVQVIKESFMKPPPCADRHQTHKEMEQLLPRPSMAGGCLCSAQKMHLQNSSIQNSTATRTYRNNYKIQLAECMIVRSLYICGTLLSLLLRLLTQAFTSAADQRSVEKEGAMVTWALWGQRLDCPKPRESKTG